MVVLDASVVIKWFKPDEKSPAADQHLADHLAHRASIFVPTLLRYEIANALWYSRRLSKAEIGEAISALDALRLTYVNPDRDLLARALAISERLIVSVYDASYVALAEQLRCDFITADKKLRSKTRSLGYIALL